MDITREEVIYVISNRYKNIEEFAQLFYNFRGFDLWHNSLMLNSIDPAGYGELTFIQMAKKMYLNTEKIQKYSLFGPSGPDRQCRLAGMRFDAYKNCIGYCGGIFCPKVKLRIYFQTLFLEEMARLKALKNFNFIMPLVKIPKFKELIHIKFIRDLIKEYI